MYIGKKIQSIKILDPFKKMNIKSVLVSKIQSMSSIGIIVAMPFNYMYGIGDIEVDLIWVVIGLLMASFGVYTLKKESKG